MKHVDAKQAVQKILAHSNVQINGSRPWDIQVSNPKFISRVLAGHSLALGESYMDGWWSCESLDQLYDKILCAGLDKKVKHEKQIFWSILVDIRNKRQH